jgi:ATP-dependent protease ClpP protease subunit
MSYINIINVNLKRNIFILFILIILNILFNKELAPQQLHKPTQIHKPLQLPAPNRIIKKYKYINPINFIKLNNESDYTYIKANYKHNNIIHIKSNGGDVYKGLDMIDFIKANNISCYAEKAYSMAFTIFQNCNERYIKYNSKLMQHQAHVYIEGKLLNVIEHIHKFKLLSDSINLYESKRINIDYKTYLNKINNGDYYFTKSDFENYRLADYYIFH